MLQTAKLWQTCCILRLYAHVIVKLTLSDMRFCGDMWAFLVTLMSRSPSMPSTLLQFSKSVPMRHKGNLYAPNASISSM